MVTKNKRKKEEIAEALCFQCKDGGLMRICDYKDCLKVYHPQCEGKDYSFLEAHTYFYCAVCGNCFYNAEFVVVKGQKGFCSECLKLARLIEENANVDSDGEMIDFRAPNTYECLFSDYYEVIKEKQGLNSKHVLSAHNFLKNGIMGQWEDDIGESEDGSDFIVSDYDDLNDTSGVKSVRKKKRCMKQLKSNLKDKKKEFIGWGSKSLIEFLKHIGRDTREEYSEHDVASIVIEYCKENKLFDTKKKRKVLCDVQLRSLFRRKSVNRNNIQKLLGPHFAENVEEVDDDITSSSEDREDNEPFKCSSHGKLLSSTKSFQLLVPDEHQNCFAAIVRSNLKLVYLKRSLVEALLKQPETFDGKVMGSFVRVKSDPNDYLQKNSHLLAQVVDIEVVFYNIELQKAVAASSIMSVVPLATILFQYMYIEISVSASISGINRSSNYAEINKEVLLHLSNMQKDVPICKISDDDFSEEECQDLYQRMRNGLLKQPTILELEQKARSLHEDIIQHTPSEQSRLLSDIPEIIPEIADNKLSPKGSPNKDRLENNVFPEFAMGKNCSCHGHYPIHGAFAPCPHNTTDNVAAMQEDPKATLSEELSLNSQTITPEKYGLRHPRNTNSSSGMDGGKLNAMNSKRAIKEKQGLSVADPIVARANDKQQDASISDISIGEKRKISNTTPTRSNTTSNKSVDTSGETPVNSSLPWTKKHEHAKPCSSSDQPSFSKLSLPIGDEVERIAPEKQPSVTSLSHSKTGEEISREAQVEEEFRTRSDQANVVEETNTDKGAEREECEEDCLVQMQSLFSRSGRSSPKSALSSTQTGQDTGESYVADLKKRLVSLLENDFDTLVSRTDLQGQLRDLLPELEKYANRLPESCKGLPATLMKLVGNISINLPVFNQTMASYNRKVSERVEYHKRASEGKSRSTRVANTLTQAKEDLEECEKRLSELKSRKQDLQKIISDSMEEQITET
ncbi:hypothetical protein RIF29_04586 [Crotalaria pallida]|uniref:Zinc finger PHD-type domain-containing protein n=1 Tax=Crotalaria pallida TaxID=3830 RepID=A0AAN9P9B4_CROPI